MIETNANLWDPRFEQSVRVITTNGFVKKDGTCVMGRGCAREARDKFPSLSIELGRKIKEEGNHVFYFPEYHLATFPTKHVWMQDSDLLLIRQSAHELVRLHVRFPIGTKFYLPRPGCGNGGLYWSDVKLVISEILTTDDYIVVDYRQYGDYAL